MTLIHFTFVFMLFHCVVCNIHNLLRHRLDKLKQFSEIHDTPVCNTDKLVIITEYQFGNTGNHIIEFTHGVWLARKLNATLVVPSWMSDIFEPFDTTILKRNYCYTTNTIIPKHIVPFEVTSEESYFIFKLFHDANYRQYLPPMTVSLIADLSLHFLKVYASLWSSPLHDIQTASEWLIAHHLGRSLNYTTVHKRQMEGGCNKIMAQVSKPSDFSEKEIAMNRPEWSGNLFKNHPLCTMPVEFVLETQTLLHRNGSRLFVAYDGAGEVDSYKKHGAVFSNVLDAHGSAAAAVGLKSFDNSKVNRKFVDMFVAMHGDLFILNPRSTFSWQIYLIRVCLSLQSVPVVRGNDFYMQSLPQDLVTGNRTVWVSWTSVVDAYASYTNKKHHF